MAARKRVRLNTDVAENEKIQRPKFCLPWPPGGGGFYCAWWKCLDKRERGVARVCRGDDDIPKIFREADHSGPVKNSQTERHDRITEEVRKFQNSDHEPARRTANPKTNAG